MSDKILVHENMLVVISSNKDVTMTYIEIAAIFDPPFWIYLQSKALKCRNQTKFFTSFWQVFD